MSNQRWVFTLVLVCGLATFVASAESSMGAPSGIEPQVASANSKLNFSSTQKWLPHFYDLAVQREKAGGLIQLAAPPPNDSNLTKNEVDQLFEWQNSRTDAWIKQILIEKDIHNATFGEFVIDDHEQLLTPVGFLVFALMDQSLGELFAQKKKFDRVRPFVLAKKLRSSEELQTLFETPFHPSYPSGHSFQAHAIALLLGAIAPEQAEATLCDAARVAIGREIAGVHYASDSAAGADLARAFMKVWLQRPEVLKQLEEAKRWWRQSRADFLAKRSFRRPQLPMEPTGPCALENVRARIRVALRKKT